MSNPESMVWFAQKSSNEIPNLKDLLEKPFLVHPQPNHNIQIHSTSSENEILNWQRGIASLFLFKQENIEVNESDVLGKCQTKYFLDHHGLHKTKEKCQSGNSEDDSVRNFHRFSVKSSFPKKL